jgi:hypothetical protein
VRKWIDQLSDPSFRVREQAVKQLYRAGPAVLPVLDRVKDGDDVEAALRSSTLIRRIRKLFLVGAAVEIKAAPSSVRWDQPFSLTVKISNPSDFPVHLPFLIQNRSLLDVDALSQEMGNMLDVADFLQVADPDGSAVEVTIDDIRGHPHLEKALDARVYDEPDSWLAPGESFSLTLKKLNRGFARYRLFKEGDYHIRFVYVPEWDDDSMREREVGKVMSNQAVVRVTQAAPEFLRTAQREVMCILRQIGPELILSIRGTFDRPIGVNLNLASGGDMKFAHIEWAWLRSGETVKAEQVMAAAGGLNPAKFKTLQPGETLELFRTSLRKLEALPGLEALQRNRGKVLLKGTYINRLDHAMLAEQRQGNEALLQALPIPTFSGSCTSAEIEVDLTKARWP